MNDRRVVITGMGIISPVGNSVREFWESLVNGRSGITPVTRFDTTRYRTKIAGEVKNFSITSYMSEKDARRLDMFCHYAIAASDEAVKDAGLSQKLEGVDPSRVGVLVSSGIGGMQTFEQQCNVLASKGPEKNSPLLIPMLIGDMASGSISMRYGARGPNFGIVSACASSCHSIGESFWIIKRGDAEIMITGGAEATISPLGFAGFCAMRAMTERNDEPLRASRPFDAQRDGFVMAEGSGVLVIEELEHAKKRGANIIAEVVGYGATADAHHITAPAPGGAGAVMALKMALDHARMNTGEVSYINAHGTSTPLNDKFETAAIKTVFGDHAKNMNISSTKGMTGHALGAAGGIETVACALTLKNGIIPPTINYENPDPDCDLNYTPNKAVEKKVGTAVNINLGFGGHNAVLILRSFTS